ncbi:MAG TPA: HTH domain-containing protein [Phycisphaerales bacterium]|nr:HTH domain-containing protein [Phycisphaerales bacterium]
MAFTKSKKTQPKALKKPPIPRRVPIAKAETSTATDSPARSKLLKAAQGEIAGRIERLEREERGEPTAPATTAHDATDATTPSDGAPSANAAHGATSPESGVPAKPAKKGKAEKPPKAPKPPKEAKPKRVSALDAAATVLRDEAKPMRAVDLIEQMEAKGLWKSPGGKTPASTLYAAMTREITQKGDASRFRKSDKGMFTAVKV